MGDTHLRNAIHILKDSTKDPMELYQPLTGQILLYDLASSESVNFLFKIMEIDCVLMKVKNANYMSNNGKLPLVRRKERIWCGFDEMASYLLSQTATWGADTRAFLDWIDSNFLKAEMFCCWCQSQTLQEYTFPRFTYKMALPLNHILFWLKKMEMQRKFKDEKSTILEDFESFLDKLESQLNFNAGDEKSWTAADALIAGHVKAIKTESGFSFLDELVSKHKTICGIMESLNNKKK